MTEKKVPYALLIVIGLMLLTDIFVLTPGLSENAVREFLDLPLVLFRRVYSLIAASASVPSYYIFSTSATYHSDYGLAYPVTYEFSIPVGSSNLKAYKMYTTSGTWSQIIEKNSNDFFNGIEAVRFDYTQNKAYVSVAFDANSNDIYLKIVDSNNNQVGTYDQIDKYYDNRQAAVTATIDDWYGQPLYIIDPKDESYNQAIDAFRQRHIWITPAIITNPYGFAANWTNIQKNLDEGYVEPASHSQTHPDVPFNNYDSEIGESKSDIINNLNLPALNKRGSQEYVYAWVEPYGHSDSTERAKLGQYKYLVDRSTVDGYTSYSTWNAVDGLYLRIGLTIEADDQNISSWAPPFPGTDVLNSKFDSAVAAGGIYHIYFHPPSVKLTDLLPHLDHIKERTNIWYVGFGHLYEYDIAAKSVVVSTDTIPIASLTVTPTTGTAPLSVNFDASKSTNVASYSMDFGDESTKVTGTDVGTATAINHVYQTAGNYTATLTVTSPDDTTASKSVNIQVDAPASALLTLTKSPSQNTYSTVNQNRTYSSESPQT